MNDATGRWSYDSKIYGHVFMGKQATQSELVTYGALVDDQHFSCFGVEGSDDGGAVGVYDPLSLTASWAWGAGVMGAIAVANRANAARPYLKLEVRGNMAPAPGDRFNKIEVETLLGEGIATTYYTQSGSVHIQEAITTYTTDAGGEDDDAYREYTTISKLTETNRDLENHLSTKYPRAVLTDDPLPPGAPSDGTYVAPSTIEGGILGRYREWIRLGYCRDYDGYADELVVKRNFQDGTGDRNRVDIFNPARMTGSLTKTATRTSFRF
jgi:phage tail sheath gpL-like